MNKLLIGAVIVVFVVVGGYFVLNRDSSTPVQEQADKVSEIQDSWVVYTNEEFGFSLQHPAGWTAEDSSLSLIRLIPPATEQMPSFNVTVSEGNLEDKITDFESSLDSQFKERILGQEEISISGENGVRITSSSAIGADYTSYFVSRDDFTIVLGGFGPVLDQIAETLSFVN